MLSFVSLRQSRGVLVVGLKIILCIVLGLFKKGLVFDDGCFIIYSHVFRGDFVGFYLGISSYICKFANMLL
jgi:hypothetical protein